ncbi:hypothetical protein B5181_39920, partial [Streptomyces sp. 4F]
MAAARGLAVHGAGVLRLGGAGRAAVLALDDRGAAVGGPQGEHGGRHDGGDDGRGDGTRAQAVPAGRAVPGVHRDPAALHVAMTHVPRARGAVPRFDRRGFPMDPRDRAARRDRLRARA